MSGPPSSPHQPKISITMTDEDVIAKVAELWGVGVFEEKRNQRRNKRWKVSYFCHTRGKPAVEWMQKLRPLMGKRRKAQIDKAIASYKDRSLYKLSTEKAKEIRALSKQGLTQKKIADRYGVSQPMIARILHGKNYPVVDHGLIA